MKNLFNPVYCIIPPHMMKSVVANGSPAQRNIALSSFVVSSQLRGRRAAVMEMVSYLMPETSPGKHRRVFSADNGTNLPGRLLRDEGGPATGDPAADEAYDGAGATYDLYWDIYQRNSLDGKGLRLDSSVHYRQGYDNAFWDGQQMVYGDGDSNLPASEQLFNRFTVAIDVIGHELTHGVTQYTSNLTYSNQSGALNESVSDVFGTLVKQRHLNQSAAEADWLIGAGLFTPLVKGVALRSMKAPGTAYDDPVLGKDPQPGDMSTYVNTSEDNGGVHINSGIPNHAFYLIAMEIGGFAWEKAGQIWYVANRDKFTGSTDFQGAANLTFEVAGQLYGQGSLEQQAVTKGWQGVGITVGAPSQSLPQPAQSDGCLTAPAALIRSIFTRG